MEPPHVGRLICSRDTRRLSGLGCMDDAMNPASTEFSSAFSTARVYGVAQTLDHSFDGKWNLNEIITFNA